MGRKGAHRRKKKMLDARAWSYQTPPTKPLDPPKETAVKSQVVPPTTAAPSTTAILAPAPQSGFSYKAALLRNIAATCLPAPIKKSAEDHKKELSVDPSISDVQAPSSGDAVTVVEQQNEKASPEQDKTEPETIQLTLDVAEDPNPSQETVYHSFGKDSVCEVAEQQQMVQPVAIQNLVIPTTENLPSLAPLIFGSLDYQAQEAMFYPETNNGQSLPQQQIPVVDPFVEHLVARDQAMSGCYQGLQGNEDAEEDGEVTYPSTPYSEMDAGEISKYDYTLDSDQLAPSDTPSTLQFENSEEVMEHCIDDYLNNVPENPTEEVQLDLEPQTVSSDLYGRPLETLITDGCYQEPFVAKLIQEIESQAGQKQPDALYLSADLYIPIVEHRTPCYIICSPGGPGAAEVKQPFQMGLERLGASLVPIYKQFWLEGIAMESATSEDELKVRLMPEDLAYVTRSEKEVTVTCTSGLKMIFLPRAGGSTTQLQMDSLASYLIRWAFPASDIKIYSPKWKLLGLGALLDATSSEDCAKYYYFGSLQDEPSRMRLKKEAWHDFRRLLTDTAHELAENPERASSSLREAFKAAWLEYCEFVPVDVPAENRQGHPEPPPLNWDDPSLLAVDDGERNKSKSGQDQNQEHGNGCCCPVLAINECDSSVVSRMVETSHTWVYFSLLDQLFPVSRFNFIGEHQLGLERKLSFDMKQHYRFEIEASHVLYWREMSLDGSFFLTIRFHHQPHAVHFRCTRGVEFATLIRTFCAWFGSVSAEIPITEDFVRNHLPPYGLSLTQMQALYKSQGVAADQDWPKYGTNALRAYRSPGPDSEWSKTTKHVAIDCSRLIDRLLDRVAFQLCQGPCGRSQDFGQQLRMLYLEARAKHQMSVEERQLARLVTRYGLFDASY